MDKSIIKPIENLLHKKTIGDDRRLIKIQQLITYHQINDNDEIVGAKRIILISNESSERDHGS